MTECERIIEQGILPASFFVEDLRCDFVVTKERKKIWAVEIDLLLELDRICQENGLTYFLSGGSLLGAVRHKGFIPWDDDIDVNMKREDYEKLLQLHNEFKNPYFLQHPKTDSGYFFSFSRLQNINTTGFSKMFAYQPMRHGIGIDIFPMDNWLETDEEGFREINELNKENGTYMRMLNPSLDDVNKKRVEEWKGMNPMSVFEKIEDIAQKYNNQDTEYLMAIVNTSYSFKKKLRPREDYDYAIKLLFEGLQLSAPVGYKRLLTIQYGDYMALPPIENRGQWHDNAVFNADIPYHEYLENN